MRKHTLTPNPSSNNDIQNIHAHERIYQAHKAFNLAYAATAISTFFSLVGATTLILGKIPAGSITTAVGLTSSLCCSRLANDANDRLDKFMTEFDNE